MSNWKDIRDGKLSKDAFYMRGKILQHIREWFSQQGFLEVETPIAVAIPEMEPHLKRFETAFASEDGKINKRLFLRTSPEIEMKKLLGAGFEKIFTITKIFRNGELSNESMSESPLGVVREGGLPPLRDTHNPEFTMMEWYRTNADYRDIMDDTEQMTKFVAKSLGLRHDLLEKPWERLSVREAFIRCSEIDLNELRTVDALAEVARKKGYELQSKYDWDDVFFLIMLNEVEPKLGSDHPVFLTDYPTTQAALSKKTSDPFFAERFELYIDRVELCNAFTELVDSEDQRSRLLEWQQVRKNIGAEMFPLDEDFLEALKTMPPTGGNALGIDRLIMVLLGKKSIQEVLLFPFGDEVAS